MGIQRRWERLVDTLTDGDDAGEVYRVLCQWVSSQGPSITPAALEEWELHALLLLDADQMPLANREEVSGSIRALAQVRPQSIGVALMLVRDLIWDLFGQDAGVQCPRTPYATLLYGTSVQTDGLLLQCPQCGHVQTPAGVTVHTAGVVRPATRAEISART